MALTVLTKEDMQKALEQSEKRALLEHIDALTAQVAVLSGALDVVYRDIQEGGIPYEVLWEALDKRKTVPEAAEQLLAQVEAADRMYDSQTELMWQGWSMVHKETMDEAKRRHEAYGKARGIIC